MVVRRIIVLGVALLLTGCSMSSGGGLDDKSRGDAAAGLVVMDADGTSTPPVGTTTTITDFVTALDSVSSGRVKATVDTRYGDPSLKDGEAQMVKDLASGAVDAAVVPARAFSAAQIPVLDVLETPFLIGSYDAERAIVTAPVADQLLARFDGSGIHALALTVGPLRHAVVAGPALTTPSAWQGQRIRTYASRVQDDAVRALGATPVHERFRWTEMIASDRLDGAEADLTNMVERKVGYGNVVTGDLVLWPKFAVIAVSDQYWKSLDETQQQWLSAAASKAREASASKQWDDDGNARTLCTRGARMSMSSDRQRADLSARLSSVTARLAADPAYATLKDIATRFPAAPLKVPTSCIANEPAVEIASPSPPASGSVLPPFPEGSYRVSITLPEVQAGGSDNHDGTTGTWTLKVVGTGYTLECRPTSGSMNDCGNATDPLGGPLEAGTVVALSDGYEFRSTPEAMSKARGCKLPPDEMESDGHCGPGQSTRVGPATVDDGTLTIGDYDGQALSYTLKTWDRIS